ncbi:hypothetical protein [Sphingomonas alba]|uniref:Uncharacterized protein n=1 Tax=Sphingomonas alba TaxID=2908208 RepID=A0ABT0RQ20_9SPHN|nr:hypothetical protein [Sphingomonas alba]MCL6684562.1 hypothetical protein [Sphingomonas alba]
MTISGVDSRGHADAAAGSVIIHGHELDPGDGDVAAMVPHGWRGIQLCYCVWDSPESPCKCMHDPRWYLPIGGIRREQRSARKDHDGKALHEFEIAKGTPVLLEMKVEEMADQAKAAAA